jgi:starch synthase
VFLMPSRSSRAASTRCTACATARLRSCGARAASPTPYCRGRPAEQTGTGFLFDEYSSQALADTLDWVLRNWRDQRGWKQLVQNGMKQDFSWDRQGPEYVALYRSLVPA